jgi:hypothetical protein
MKKLLTLIIMFSFINSSIFLSMNVESNQNNDIEIEQNFLLFYLLKMKEH